MWHEQLRNLMQIEFEKKRSQNEKYSMRAFAKDIELSQSAVSNFLASKGEWQLTPERGIEILDRLKPDPTVRRRIIAEMGKSEEYRPVVLPEYPREFFTDWDYAAVFTSHELPREMRNASAIARRIGISPERAQSIIDHLIRVELLIKDDTGSLKPREAQIGTTDGPTSEAVRKCQEARLLLAQRALNEQTTAQRDFTSLTFTGNQKSLDRFRSEIRKLYEKTVLLDEGECNDNVYQLSIQLFPLDFPEDKPKSN